MKNIYINIFLICVICLSSLSSCSDKKEGEIEEPTTTTNIYDSEIIKSQKAYDRGFTEGRRIASMKEGYEREKALIELHSLISSLERNGFPQTASDFSKGLKAALAESKAEV